MPNRCEASRSGFLRQRILRGTVKGISKDWDVAVYGFHSSAPLTEAIVLSPNAEML